MSAWTTLDQIILDNMALVQFTIVKALKMDKGDILETIYDRQLMEDTTTEE